MPLEHPFRLMVYHRRSLVMIASPDGSEVLERTLTPRLADELPVRAGVESFCPHTFLRGGEHIHAVRAHSCIFGHGVKTMYFKYLIMAEDTERALTNSIESLRCLEGAA